MKRSIIATLLVAILLTCSFATTAFAAESSEPTQTTILSSTDVGKHNVYSDVWSTIYHGTGKSATIHVRNDTSFYLDIQMLDANGNQLWYQRHTVAAGGTGHYNVGADVKALDLDVQMVLAWGQFISLFRKRKIESATPWLYFEPGLFFRL